jgi:hypothetical protein
MPFPSNKPPLLEVKNVPVCCNVKNQWVPSPQLSSLAPHGINKPFQHFHVECLINMAPSGTNSKWVVPLMSKKQISVVLTLHLTFVASLPWGILRSPLHGQAFSLRIILITAPRFITSDDTIQHIIFLKSFCKVHSQSDMSVLFFLHQVSWLELHCWLSHAKILY